MKIIKVIEVIASSETGFDDAAQNAIIEASKSIQNIQSIYIKEMKAKVKNNQITSYEIIGKISFVVDKKNIIDMGIFPKQKNRVDKIALKQRLWKLAV